MTNNWLALIFLLGVTYGNAYADEASVKKIFLSKFPGANVQSVSKAPMKGMYEIYAEGQLLYTNESVSHLLIGNLIDVANKQNLTDLRMQKLMAVPFHTLPLNSAITSVKGNGKRKLAVFSDPDCPYCKKLEEELRGISNVTIYTFLYPVEGLHAGSTDKAKAIWCAPDRLKAWEDWMLLGSLPKTSGSCETPIPSIVSLGQKLGITGTPTLIFADGRRVPGAIPPAQIEKILDATQSK